MKQKKLISVYILFAALCVPFFPLSVVSAVEDINALQNKEGKTEDQLNKTEKEADKMESELHTLTQNFSLQPQNH